MSRVVVYNHLTLDGVMQAPGRPDEDRRGGFEHGGWATPVQRRGDGQPDGRRHGQGRGPAARAADLRGLLPPSGPTSTDNPFTAVLNNTQKYVASTTLDGAAPVEQLDAARGRRRRGRGQAQAAAGQGSRGARQRRAGPVADAAQPRRRVRAARSTRSCWDRAGACSPTAARSPRSGSSTPKTTTTGVVIATYQPAEPVTGNVKEEHR